MRKGDINDMNITEPEIEVIGASIIDVLVRPAREEVFESGSYEAEDIKMSIGADALNEATILARMGKKVRLETIIGKDQAGRFIYRHCEKEGIQLGEGCLRDDETTGINVVLVEPDGNRDFLTNGNGTLRSLTIDDIHMPFPDSVKIICFASIFVFPKIGTKEMQEIFETAKKQGKIVCADMTKCKHGETVEDLAPALAHIDYLLPNDEEAMRFTRTDCVEDAADRLKAAGVGNVIIKCGKRGCYIRTDEEARWMSAVEGAHCIDTTGAGDSFVAGFLCALLEGKNVIECAENGGICGAKAVEVMGATEWI